MAMKVCLVSPPIITELEGTPASRAGILHRTAEPPLGILSLAALLEERGIYTQVLDVDRFFFDAAEGTKGTFFARAVDEIGRLDADVFGFGTLAGSYPLTIRLAGATKRVHPRALVVLGGPQATAADTETMEAFPFVDLIVRGEADETFPRLLYALGNSEPLAGMVGITYRSAGSTVRTADAPVVTDLDSLPTPSFHFWPRISARRCISLEAGRGCPFACTFCSTSPFFHRQYRMKSPQRLIEQMRSIRQGYGVDLFHLIHDSLAVRRDRVVAFCEALLESGEQFHWTCSARTDCIDEELLELMAKAGCTGVYFGIETGSVRIQPVIDKNLDLDQAAAAIRHADRCGVSSSVSLIIGFPEDTPDDLRATVHFIIDSLRFDKVIGQIHLLTPVAGSSLHDQYRERLLWDGVFSELTFQNWLQDSADYRLIQEHPQVFADFFAIPTPFLDRHYLMELRDFFTYGTARFRWLVIALHQHSGDLVAVFDRWRQWRGEHRATTRADAQYYASDAFRGEFLELVESAYLEDDDAEALAVATLLEYELELERVGERSASSQLALPATGGEPLVDLRMVPRVAPGVVLVRLSADYQGVIDCLRNRKSPRDVPRRPVVVADRQAPDESAEVLQLTPLSAALIELCNGARTAADIATLFPGLQDGLDRFPPEAACLFALGELARQGLIVLSPRRPSIGQVTRRQPRKCLLPCR